MTTFDPSLHPRTSTGRFTRTRHLEPVAALAPPGDPDLDRRLADAARVAEGAAARELRKVFYEIQRADAAAASAGLRRRLEERYPGVTQLQVESTGSEGDVDAVYPTGVVYADGRVEEFDDEADPDIGADIRGTSADGTLSGAITRNRLGHGTLSIADMSPPTDSLATLDRLTDQHASCCCGDVLDALAAVNRGRDREQNVLADLLREVDSFAEGSRRRGCFPETLSNAIDRASALVRAVPPVHRVIISALGQLVQ